MCGRFIFDGDIQDIIDKYEIMDSKLSEYSMGEIYPSNNYPIVIDRGVRELTTMSWGFSASYLKSLVINARCETLHEKKMFKGLLVEQRCIIPATGFFEWMEIGGKKRKHIIRFANKEIFSMAGLYRDFIDKKGEAYRGFTIITTEANSVVANIHDRMPVILQDEEIEAWLNPKNKDILSAKSMLRPFQHLDKQLELMEY